MSEKIDVQRVANLAYLKLNSEESVSYKKDMERILEYMETLSSVNTDHIEPTVHVSSNTDCLRVDELHEHPSADKITKNAAETKDTAIRVPSIIG